jgi:hypothetical protein
MNREMCLERIKKISRCLAQSIAQPRLVAENVIDGERPVFHDSAIELADVLTRSSGQEAVIA